MPYSFYTDPEYQERQALITKENWKAGIYDFKIKPLVSRVCKNQPCSKMFWVKPGDHKQFCSKRCSALIYSKGRVLSELTKSRISRALLLLPKSRRGKHFTKPKVKMVCIGCQKTFEVVPYQSKTRKYCSMTCSITTIGRQTTSPKASKGKSGIRIDIDPRICFYSTWEANIARVFNLVGIEWEYAPRIFDLGKHTYRPDFFLPKFNTYIEVKNFMGQYSLERDQLFRQKYPLIKLELTLKNKYLEIKSNYQDLVDNWEY